MGSVGRSMRAFSGRFVIAFVVAAAVMAGAVVGVNYAIDRKLDAVPRIKVATAAEPPGGANYLLIGSDSRKFVANENEQEAFGSDSETGGQRSDTMMVVHVEPGAKRTLVVSFPRDLWVRVPGVGMSKINAAFNYGPDRVVATLRSNFGIDINHYVEVDFKSFEGVVNAIGNVRVYLPYAARDKKTGLFAPGEGCYALDGPAALAYVRSRSLEYFDPAKRRWVSADLVPDIARIGRQQEFIRKMAGLAVQKSLDNPLTANRVTDRVLENLTIDDSLSKRDIFDLIGAFRTVNPNDPNSIEFATLPWEEGPLARGQSVLYVKDPDADALMTRLRDFSGDEGPAPSSVPPESVHLRVLNGSGREGLAAATLEELARFGFRGLGAGNDPRGRIRHTEVRYRPGAEDKGRLTLGYLKPQARLVEDPDLRGVDVAVVLGTDFDAILAPAGVTTATTATTVPSATAPSGSSTSLVPERKKPPLDQADALTC